MTSVAPVMSPCPDDNELAQLVDGSISDVTRARVEGHLDTCTLCTQLVAELAWVVAPARAAPPGYRLLRALDDTAWEALDTRHDRRVAIAFAPAHTALADVQHANVARVYEVGELDGEPFIVSELVTTTEAAWRSAEPRSFASILGVWRQALAGLAALHRAGVTHALSPDRVFVDDGRVLVAGFGRPLDRTAGYLAREVLEGKPESPLTDQVAAAVSIFEALADRKPFTGATVGALAVAMSSPPDPPSFDRRISNVIVRGLAARPGDRWPTIDAFAAALANPPRDCTKLVVAAAAAIALAILLLLAR